VNIKQKGRGAIAPVKYSEISKRDFNGTSPVTSADLAAMYLLRNGYCVMQGYAINEVIKLIRSLRELGVEYTMRTIEGNESIAGDKKWKEMYYEFTTVLLEDDRHLPPELSDLSDLTLFNELKNRCIKNSKNPNSKLKMIVTNGDRGFISFNGTDKKEVKPGTEIIYHDRSLPL
jgi:hypothetical protein